MRVEPPTRSVSAATADGGGTQSVGVELGGGPEPDEHEPAWGRLSSG